ncbi:MAG: hypothetical protein CL578_03540 [Alteromonadaceae bacterium]|uniref:FFLEELY motif protein n=1 Tax=Paraglaciecola chathamensis TaxID=368405 RepID=UPI000C61F989|nr:hypothetical protein [Paraglaciecola agarilytica]MBN24107.1 hypothetical protein [Alteromonadaceae bacterium]|tara:strand:- start:10221 stop:11024 length:804 start_codon:yes stop_codon:yes gene_type:complete
MTDLVAQVSRHLHRVHALQEMATKAKLLPLVQGVQRWQTLRMQATHEGHINDPRTAPALAFFVEQIYGPQDFSQRDADIQRVVPKMHKYMPSQALRSLESALRLHALSYELDYALALALKSMAQVADTLCAKTSIVINSQTYAAAYCKDNNANLRQEQISLLIELGENLSQAVAIKGVAMMLSLSKHPARMKGLQALHLFLHDGYKAFKKIPNSQRFMDDIVSKEARLVAILFNKQFSEQVFSQQVFSQQGINPLPCLPSIEIPIEA